MSRPRNRGRVISDTGLAMLTMAVSAAIAAGVLAYAWAMHHA